MTATIAAAVPRSFAAERMEYQSMLAMLRHGYRLTHRPENSQETDHRSKRTQEKLGIEFAYFRGNGIPCDFRARDAGSEAQARECWQSER
jgi:hypothetical protein